MIRKIILAAAVAVIAFPGASQAGFSFGLNEKDVEGIIQKYIEENPQLIVDSFTRYNLLQEYKKAQEGIKRLNAVRDELENDPALPVMGNPAGDVTVVEFFDYNCGYCKMMALKATKAITEDGNIRWVMHDLPVLRPSSTTAAKAALAAHKQGKYKELHEAFMIHQGPLTDEEIKTIAAGVEGLDMAKLEQDMQSDEVQAILNKNRELADKLELSGVPQFIIGNYISNGAMMGNELQENVAIVRQEAKK